MEFPRLFFWVWKPFSCFSLTPFCRDRGSGSCFTAQFPGIGIICILAWRGESRGVVLFVKSFENFWRHYAAVRQGQLVAMRHGTNFFIYGMHVSAVLRGLTSHTNILIFGGACCHFACASVGSTFALLASFCCSRRGPSTTYVGVKSFRRIARTRILDPDLCAGGGRKPDRGKST